MSRLFFYLGITACALFNSCHQDNRTQKLDEREALLNKREQALLAKEADYRLLADMRDSLRNMQQDTSNNLSLTKVANWTDSLVGNWDSRLLCTSTTCKSYVIGDQRTEQWQFLQDSIGLYLAIEGKSSGVKRYRCEPTANIRELRLVSTGDEAGSATQNLLTFSSNSGTVIRGQQRTTGIDNCKLTFSVQLTPKQ